VNESRRTTIPPCVANETSHGIMSDGSAVIALLVDDAKVRNVYCV
jgi:hypothetical protein